MSATDEARAAELLARAKWVAGRLCDEGAECLSLDTVLAIAGLDRSDPRRARVAGAFEAWARGTAAGKLRPDLRFAQLQQATSAMRALQLPVTARVETRIAAAHFDANEWHAGLAQLAALKAAHAHALARSALLRGQVEWYRGMFLIATGHAGEALRCYESALAEFEAVGVDTGAGMMELLIAETLRHVGAFEEAWNHHLRAIDRLGRTGEGFRLIMAISSAGKTAQREHSDRVAVVLHEAAVRLAVQERQPEFECHALVSRAQVADVSPAEGARYVREAEHLASLLIVADPIVAPQYVQDAPALPGARREAALRQRFADSVLLTRADATPARFLELAEHAEVIHFAGHTLGGRATHSAAFALTPDVSEPDGLVGAEDIERHTFARARLVVLAACSTSAGRVGSEGTMSLARAFLAGGAGSVVATLLPVDDEATARLWPVFYQAWIRGASPAEALRDAQLSLLRDSVHGEARNWAAFQVSGPI